MQTRNSSPTMEYITRTFVREPDWLAPVRAEGEKRRPGMQVSPYEGHLLQWLVRLTGAASILEIGTFMGYSTLWMAGALPEEGHIDTLEFDAGHAAQSLQHFSASPHEARITLHQGDAHAWLAAQPNMPTYDFVFMDADKKGYAKYLDAVLPRMNPHGVIVGDNTLLFGAMAGEAEGDAASKAAMTTFNETLADPSRFESILLPTLEGLTVARLR